MLLNSCFPSFLCSIVKEFLFVGDCLRYTVHDDDQPVERYIDCEIIEEIFDTLQNCTYCDLATYFEEDYLLHERRFEFDNNWHWNSYGNRVVICSIEDVMRLKGMI